MYDIAIVGAGPAGVSAALTAKARNKNVMLVSNDPHHSPLARAERIDNYPGLAQVSGSDMVQGLIDQLRMSGIEWVEGRVTSVTPLGQYLPEELSQEGGQLEELLQDDAQVEATQQQERLWRGYFMLGVGSDVIEARSLILALGLAPARQYPGEAELLGHGVSYCATCDGMLYRNRAVCVVGNNDEAQEEANFLASIGCEVTYVGKGAAPLLSEDILLREGRNIAVQGDEMVTGLLVDGDLLPCDAVFILRPAVAPGYLLDGLEMDGAFIRVDAAMATSVPGVFAAGDCTGKPLQVAKAVGEGQLAAFAAVGYLEKLEKAEAQAVQ